MSKNSFIFYNDYLKKRNIENKKILISRTKNSYLIGPIINNKFDENSFYKRIKSSSIYNNKIYKRIPVKKVLLLINNYEKKLKNNEVIEILKNNEIIIHKIIKVPGDKYE